MTPHMGNFGPQAWVLFDLIERTFQREGSPYLACNDRNAFLHQKSLKNIMYGHVKMYVMR